MSIDIGDRERAIKIASVALSRAMAGDLPDAASYVGRLNHSDGLLLAIVAWIDTFIAKVYPEAVQGQRVAVRWLNLPTGEVETADEVSVSMRWAGRLIAARQAGDEAGFYAVLTSLPEGAPLGDGVMALLHIVATGIKDPAASRVAAGLSPSDLGGDAA